MTALENMKKVGHTVLSLLTAPQFTTFIILTWFYQMTISFITIIIPAESWMVIGIWTDFGKEVVKDTATLFLAALSKILKAAFQTEADNLKNEMSIISKSALSMMNKCLVSQDTEIRTYAMAMGNALIGQGVDIYLHAFDSGTDEKVNAVISEMESEKKK